METYGDLKKAIKSIQLKQKGEKVGKVTVDVILGAIPGLGAAKSTFDVLSAAFRKPDTKKSNSWLDKLDIDDEMEAIVDDTVENGFLKFLSKAFDSESDDKPLEQDFNMNAKMVDYLKKNYKQRTVTGISEQKSVFDQFFTKFAYKFDKGYPDMNSDQDVLLLETLLSEFLGKEIKIEETALSPGELSKDATLPGGVKTPRIEILVKKIENNEELELNDGSKFVVGNKEEVLSQLKGKTRITNAIKLVDKEGNTITTSNLKKTSDFGGGGGMRGGSDLTAKGESAQAIVNAIRYSLSGDISEEDITDEAINDTKSDVRVTDFEGAKELLKDNPGWLTSSVSIANALASKYSGPFIQNRGSEWVENLEKAVKPHLEKVGMGNINKWSPADIWMVSPDEMGISWPNTLDQINSLLLKKYNEGKIIGVSLKKAGKDATLKVFNSPDGPTDTYKFEGIDVRPTHAKGFILFDGGKMEFRNFNGLGGFQGEIIGKKAAAGKVGYGIIKKALADNEIEISSPSDIKQEVLNDSEEFKSKFKKLWSSTPGLEASEFEQYYNNPEKTQNQNLSYRISKYLGLEVVNAINNSPNPDKIIADLLNYASSQTGDSAIFVKAS